MTTAEVKRDYRFVDDHPESISRLRRLIIALAIRGKLIGDGANGTASVDLVEQLEARRRQLGQEGKPTRVAKLTAISERDLPKVCPVGPLYLRLGDIARVEKGLTGIASAKPGPYPLVVTAQERATCDHYDFDAAAAIIPLVSSAGHGKASLQRLHYQEGKFALGSILAAAIPYAPDLISPRFIYEFLTAFKDELLVSQMIGTANVSLSVGKVASTPIPLVSRATQRTVDALMALCDQLEAARTAREATRDKLTAASLARLNDPDPDPAIFAQHARFALDALPTLTARADQIKQLRQTILGLAVRGKLVPQNPTDEQVAELTERLRSRRVVAADLPSGWRSSTVGEILDIQYGRGLPASDRLQSGPVPVYGSNGIVAYTTQSLTRRPAVIIGRKGSAGALNLCDGPSWTTDVAYFVEAPSFFNLRFLFMALASLDLGSLGKGVKPGLSRSDASELVVWVPPLMEQRRIVAKVDALMMLCDRLEAGIGARDDARRRLLDSLLAESLQRHESSTESDLSMAEA